MLLLIPVNEYTDDSPDLLTESVTPAANNLDLELLHPATLSVCKDGNVISNTPEALYSPLTEGIGLDAPLDTSRENFNMPPE